ncbi:PAS domain-containing protein [Arcticibacter sp.]|uniref:PAS domain-containing protein n=1 Tax=Arcticibacter sp. TaxID=1872630 RepID=UPI003891177B
MKDLSSQVLPPIALRVFETLPAYCVVLSPRLTILTVSDNLVKLTGKPRNEIRGHHFFDFFPGLPASGEKDTSISASLREVLRTKQPHQIPLTRIDLPDPLNFGNLKETYWQVIHQPVLAETGDIAYIIHEIRNEFSDAIAARKLLEVNEWNMRLLNGDLQQAYEELQASNEELMSGNEELSAINEELQQMQDELARLNENLESRIRERTAELAISEQKIRSLVESAPFPIGVYTGPEMRIELLNQAIIDTWNRGTDLIGKTYAEVLPELADKGVYEHLDRVYRTGTAYHAENERVDLVVDGTLQSFYFNYDFTPLFDSDGHVYGIMNTAADVTELVNAKLQAEQSGKTLYNIMMRSPVSKCILLGPDHTVTVANDRMIALWGKPREAMMNKPLFEGLPDAKNQGLEHLLKEVFTLGKTIEARERAVTLLRDNKQETLYVDFVYQPYRDAQENIIGVMATAIDVTSQVTARDKVQHLNEELAATNEELQAANEEQSVANEELASLNDALKISQDELELAIDAAGLGTWDFNPVTGKFSGNDLMRSWFGLQPEEQIDLSAATSVIAETDRKRVMDAIARALIYESGGSYQIDYTIINPLTNAPREVRASGKALFDDERRATRLSGVLQDVTEQKKDEQRKNDFIGIVSHELKTPLTSIKALLQVAAMKLAKTDDTFLKGAIEKSNIQVKKMETMISGFLNVSRLESGKMQIEKTGFNLQELLTEIIKETEISLSTHQIQFLPCDPIEVQADHDKISLVVSNLLSNAVKYSPKGKRIEVGCVITGPTVQVSVKDEGFGIKEEHKESLFERYFRVETSYTRHISGFGIGLYLCAEIIARHHGRIWVESTEGEGSTFFFTLPL